MKRIISLFLTVTMIASLIVAIPVTNVAAAETITDEALFMTYPTYLSNSEMDEGLAKAEAAYYAVINSYSDSDETVAALMTSMSDGISILVKEGLANLGYGETLYETQAREAATKYMQSMLTNENVIKKASGIVDKAYKTLKTSYSIASNVDKTTMMADLVKVATENDISIKPDDIDDLVNDLYDAGTLKTDLAAIGEANKLWKIVFEFTEIHAIEKTTLDLLVDELSKSGQTGSDLYLGLSLLKDDMEKDSASYVLKYYLNDKTVSYLADKVDDLIGAVTSANAVSLVTTCMKVFADYIYVNAKAEDITQAIMQTSFVSSIDICLSQYRLKFLQGTGTTEDIQTYESLYGAYLAAHKATLDTCYDVAKITDKYSLGGDCMIWSSNIETLYTYDKYIEWCKEEVAHDISNSELDKTTGSSTITDALNEETIASRLERVFRLYPAGSKWAKDYDGTKSSLGYVGKVFNHIFDESMCVKVQNDYQYILTSNRNVRLIGRLEEDGVTEDALKDLFANVRIGDIVITSGQYDYLHAMTVVGMGETGPIVYDVDSKYGPAEEYTHLIQKYEFPYSKMADAFGSNGKYLTKPGISVYRAIKKVNTTNSGTSLYYEEYDDSVNYVIEDGVLTGYNGSRTTIEIPDGVTSIAAYCFQFNSKIKYVYMPDTITDIGPYAFDKCENLCYVKLSKNLKDINVATFLRCSSLTNIVLPNGLYSILSGAFCDSALTSVNIPDSVEIISEYAFENCTNLKIVTLGKNVRVIEGCAFRGCLNLETVYWNSLSQESFYISTGGAFWNAGKDCGGFTVIFGSDVKLIPDYALYSSDYLKTAIIPEGVSKIGSDAFWACQNLTDVNMPDSLARIEDEAFSQCEALRGITIPEKVSYIGDGAFFECKGLEIIYWNAANVSDFLDSPFRLITANSKNLKVIFGEDVKSIPANVLCSCEQVTEIILGENVERIGEYAFSGTSVSGKLELPSKLTTVGNGAFSKTSVSGSLFIPDNVTEIGYGAFNNTQITDITIPESIGQGYSFRNFFDHCENLENIYVSPKNENMKSEDGLLYFSLATGDLLFMIPPAKTEISISTDCIDVFYPSSGGKLEKITVKEGNKALQVVDNILYNKEKTKLLLYPSGKSSTSFSVPDGIKTIGQKTFSRSKNLETITLPNSIESIDDYAFFGCENLRYIYYDGTESDWEKISVAEGNDYLLNATIHYNYTTEARITALTVDDLGTINLTAINVPDDAVVYVASYDTLGKLLELQNLTLNNGSASAIFSTSGVHKYKAFIWKGDTIRPLSEPKEYILK